jgi:hypothetical protein
MKKILLILICCGPLCLAPAMADVTEDRDAVVMIVQAFFDAMTDRDVERMKSMLTPDGIFYGYRESPEGVSILRRPHQAYVEGLAEGDGKLVERFWDPQVLLHDRMAAVWTPYDLYIDGVFSHCGIDNFNFLKTDEGWKITGIVFSMEPDDCAESPLGPLQD